MPRITIDLETIKLIDGIKEQNESITMFIHRCIDKLLKENYDIDRSANSNGRRKPV